MFNHLWIVESWYVFDRCSQWLQVYRNHYLSANLLLNFVCHTGWRDSTLAEESIYDCDYSWDDFEAKLDFGHVTFASEHRNTNALTWEPRSQDILL